MFGGIFEAFWFVFFPFLTSLVDFCKHTFNCQIATEESITTF